MGMGDIWYRNKMTIKLMFSKASIHQHDDIDHLMLDAFTPYVQKLNPQATAGPYPWLAAAIERGDVYVGHEGARIVGVVTTSCRGQEFVIGQLGVDPAKQGKGIGSWLLDQLEQVARHKNLKNISLQTAEIMPDLLRLYDRHGFKQVYKVLPEHGDDEHLRVHMTKLL